MEIQQDPPSLPLSFAYNDSLVEQLANSKPKHSTMKTKDPSCVGVVNGNVSPNQNSRKQHAQQQQHKKQIRRRLHTAKPYQERLMNMAEARREIVTALKYHRAAMKQANDDQHRRQHQYQHQQSLTLQTSHLSSFDQDGRFKSRRNPRIYPSCTTKFSSYMDDFSYSSSFSPPYPPPLVPISYPKPSPVTFPFAHPPPKVENPNFTLPNQTLGLNLNLHHFNNLEATFYLNNTNNNHNNLSLCSYSSPTPSPPPLVTNQDVPSVGISSHSKGEGVSSVVDTNIIESSATIHATTGGLQFHSVMDDEGMAEIRSLGEQHQMEWNDTMSLVTSAWWFSCLKNMEHDGATHEVKTDEDGASHDHHIFDDELIEFPTWLNNNANEMFLEQCSQDYFQDFTTPW